VEALQDDGPGAQPWDIFSLAAVAPLRNRNGFHVAPAIPGAVVHGVTRSYLTLRPGELLLAVFDRSGGAEPSGSCTLTSRRVCWFEPRAADDPADVHPQARPYEQSVGYDRLPEVVGVKGWFAPALDLGDCGELSPRRVERHGLVALGNVLNALGRGARTGDLAGSVPAGALEQARAEVAEVVRKSEAVQNFAHDPGEREAVTFHAVVRRATPRVIVTPLIIGACVLVYVAMLASGVSGTDPSAQELYKWGGGSGAAMALDAGSWRLLTAMFLHGGLLHILLNMWCLGSSGPLIERLYGNVGFALLYLFAGLGGSLASAWWHPMVVGVGASGAIFGVLGGLLAFLVVHRHAIPESVLGPLRSSVLGFVGYNGVYGLMTPGIDNAAHIGGLVTGFATGLLLSRPWPASRPFEGVARQAAVSVLLAAGLVPLGLFVGTRIRQNRQVVAMVRETEAPAVAYNELITALKPQTASYASLNQRIDAFLDRLVDSTPNDPKARKELASLIADAESSKLAVEKTPVSDPDLVALRRSFGEAFAHISSALRVMNRFLDHPEQPLITGPGGFNSFREKSNSAVQKYDAVAKEYFAKHGMVAVKPDADQGKPGR
jgi:rhomboid protease GluP